MPQIPHTIHLISSLLNTTPNLFLKPFNGETQGLPYDSFIFIASFGPQAQKS
jgi:hypothetical protein